MKCPTCKNAELRVQRTYNVVTDGKVIFQARKCPACKVSFTTRVQIISGRSPYLLAKEHETDTSRAS